MQGVGRPLRSMSFLLMITRRLIQTRGRGTPQNDRNVLSFRLWGRSTSRLFKKSLSGRKGAGTSQGQKKNNNTISF